MYLVVESLGAKAVPEKRQAQLVYSYGTICTATTSTIDCTAADTESQAVASPQQQTVRPTIPYDYVCCLLLAVSSQPSPHPVCDVASRPASCSRSVDFPTPGSPPSITMLPGTSPPPSTRGSSEPGRGIRSCFSAARTSAQGQKAKRQEGAAGLGQAGGQRGRKERSGMGWVGFIGWVANGRDWTRES